MLNMLSKTTDVPRNSELGQKVISLEDIGVKQHLFSSMMDCIVLVREANLMGGKNGEFEKKMLELQELVRDDMNKSINKLLGVDENTEIIITTDTTTAWDPHYEVKE
jgi:hypothetical protein